MDARISHALIKLVAAAFVAGSFLVAVPSTPAVAAKADGGYAPVGRPGPQLSVPAKRLARAVKCKGNFRANDLEPVLLNPATAVTADENFSWNWERAFNAQHRPWCAVTVPFHTLGDIQTAGEYIVYAIRHIHRLAGRRVAVMGHSQGGMSMRWALRFWPDTRAMVDDVIGMAPDNHGTTLVDPICVKGRTTCTPAVWQQGSKSDFIAALNSKAETFKGISYTEIYSHTDEVVLPSTGASPSAALHTGAGKITNIATQDVCGGHLYEHLLIGTIDPVAHAIAMDALRHKGPAKPSRIGRSSCLELLMPGVDLLNVADNFKLVQGLPNVLLVPVPFVNLVGAPQLKREPKLRCYVFAAGC